MWAYLVAAVCVLTDRPYETASYWVLGAIFATLQAIYWQRESGRG
jgi:hypothetical protein